MTVEKFREITSRPGDKIPLQPQLAKIPWWTNVVVKAVLTNFDGRGGVTNIVSRQRGRSVAGKYIVLFSEPESDRPARKTLLTYDEKSSAYKFYGTFGTGPGYESLTEGVTVYDFAHKTFSSTNTFGYTWREIVHGSYSSTNMSATTTMSQDNRVLWTSALEIEASPERAAPRH